MSEKKATAKRLEKFPAIDGFRGIGVLVVVFTHCPEVIESSLYNWIWKLNQLSRVGYIALDIFFVISGFFITRLLLRERAKTGHISFKNFYARRVLRIFPIYYLAVFICYFVFHFGASDTLSLVTYTFNFYHPFHAAPNALEHTWSLSVEEQFYFFWPLLILLVPQRHLGLVTGRVLPALAIVSGLAMAVLLNGQDKMLAGNVVYMSLFTRMLSLSLGGWLAVREFEGRPLRGWRCLMLLIAALVLLLIDRVGRESGFISSQAVYWTIALAAYAMVSVAFTCTLVFDRGIVQRWMTAILSLSVLRGFGHLSYAIYLFHLPVLFVFGLNEAAIGGGKAPIMMVLLAVAITIGLSVLSYYLIESPLASLKQNFGGPSVGVPAARGNDAGIGGLPTSGAGAVVSGPAGWLFGVMAGFMGRVNAYGAAFFRAAWMSQEERKALAEDDRSSPVGHKAVEQKVS